MFTTSTVTPGWQSGCNEFGFNPAGRSKAFLGLVMNQEPNCATPDTIIGLEVSGGFINPQPLQNSGSVCGCCAGMGKRIHTPPHPRPHTPQPRPRQLWGLAQLRGCPDAPPPKRLETARNGRFGMAPWVGSELTCSPRPNWLWGRPKDQLWALDRGNPLFWPLGAGTPPWACARSQEKVPNLNQRWGWPQAPVWCPPRPLISDL